MSLLLAIFARAGLALAATAIPPTPESRARVSAFAGFRLLDPWQQPLAATPGSRPALERAGRTGDDPQETWALPLETEHWSLTTLREKLIKIGAKVVRHGRYVTFQLAEVAVPRELFRKILSLIDDLRPRPAPA